MGISIIFTFVILSIYGANNIPISCSGQKTELVWDLDLACSDFSAQQEAYIGILKKSAIPVSNKAKFLKKIKGTKELSELKQIVETIKLLHLCYEKANSLENGNKQKFGLLLFNEEAPDKLKEILAAIEKENNEHENSPIVKKLREDKSATDLFETEFGKILSELADFENVEFFKQKYDLLFDELLFNGHSQEKIDSLLLLADVHKNAILESAEISMGDPTFEMFETRIRELLKQMQACKEPIQMQKLLKNIQRQINAYNEFVKLRYYRDKNLVEQLKNLENKLKENNFDKFEAGLAEAKEISQKLPTNVIGLAKMAEDLNIQKFSLSNNRRKSNPALNLCIRAKNSMQKNEILKDPFMYRTTVILIIKAKRIGESERFNPKAVWEYLVRYRLFDIPMVPENEKTIIETLADIGKNTDLIVDKEKRAVELLKSLDKEGKYSNSQIQDVTRVLLETEQLGNISEMDKVKFLIEDLIRKNKFSHILRASRKENGKVVSFYHKNRLAHQNDTNFISPRSVYPHSTKIKEALKRDYRVEAKDSVMPRISLEQFFDIVKRIKGNIEKTEYSSIASQEQGIRYVLRSVDKLGNLWYIKVIFRPSMQKTTDSIGLLDDVSSFEIESFHL